MWGWNTAAKYNRYVITDPPVFKTTAIDHSAIPPRRNSGHNSQLSRESTPTHPASVTVSVTIATARDDAGPATSGYSTRPLLAAGEPKARRPPNSSRTSHDLSGS